MRAGVLRRLQQHRRHDAGRHVPPRGANGCGLPRHPAREQRPVPGSRARAALRPCLRPGLARHLRDLATAEKWTRAGHESGISSRHEIGSCLGVHGVGRNRCGPAGRSLGWRLPQLGSGGGGRVSGCPDGLVVRQRYQAQDRRHADGVRILPRGAGLRAVAPGAATRHARRRPLDTGSQADRRHDAPGGDVQHTPGAL